MVSVFAPVFFMGKLTALAFIDSALSTGDSIAVPSAAEVGDLAVVVALSRRDTVPTAYGTPSGWTNAFEAGAYDGSVSAHRHAYFHKVLADGDLGASPSFANTATVKVKTMLIFRPNAAITAVTKSSGIFQATTGPPAGQSVPGASFAGPGVVLAGATATSVNLSASPAFDALITLEAPSRVGYAVKGQPPVNHAVTLAATGTTRALSSIFINVE